jgi:hypothetical protein
MDADGHTGRTCMDSVADSLTRKTHSLFAWTRHETDDAMLALLLTSHHHHHNIIFPFLDRRKRLSLHRLSLSTLRHIVHR